MANAPNCCPPSLKSLLGYKLDTHWVYLWYNVAASEDSVLQNRCEKNSSTFSKLHIEIILSLVIIYVLYKITFLFSGKNWPWK